MCHLLAINSESFQTVSGTDNFPMSVLQHLGCFENRKASYPLAPHCDRSSTYQSDVLVSKCTWSKDNLAQ